MLQSIKHPTLGFGSGRDLRVMRLSPSLGSVLGAESAWGSLPLPPLCTCALSPSPSLLNKYIFKKKIVKKKNSVASTTVLFRKCFFPLSNANVLIYFFLIINARILLIGIPTACRLDLFLAVKKNRLGIKYNYYFVLLSLQPTKLL